MLRLYVPHNLPNYDPADVRFIQRTLYKPQSILTHMNHIHQTNSFSGLRSIPTLKPYHQAEGKIRLSFAQETFLGAHSNSIQKLLLMADQCRRGKRLGGGFSNGSDRGSCKRNLSRHAELAKGHFVLQYA
jgi:hypothetical protein